MDSHREITLALMHVLADFGLPLPFDEAAGLVDGAPLESIWERVSPRLSAPAARRGYEAFASGYRSQYMTDLGHATEVFRDVERVLSHAFAHPARPRMAVVSNKSAPSVPALLARFGLDQYFHVMLGCGGTAIAPKPDPALLLHAAQALAVKPEHCAMIGDTALDVDAGRRAGMVTIALTHGMATPEALAHADHVIGSFAELLLLIDASAT